MVGLNSLPRAGGFVVAFNPHFPDNQTMVAGAIVPRQMFQEILLLIAARRATPEETPRPPAAHEVYIACILRNARVTGERQCTEGPSFLACLPYMRLFVVPLRGP
jgi:hypothetical protein